MTKNDDTGKVARFQAALNQLIERIAEDHRGGSRRAVRIRYSTVGVSASAGSGEPSLGKLGR